MARDLNGVRERILDAALERLRAHGVKSLTQPQVAKAAGVLQSHLTYYFPKRTDLLLAVARHSTEAVALELREFLGAHGFPSADEGVRARVQALVTLLTKNRERTRMLLALLVEADEDPALKAVMVENVGYIRALVALAMERPLDDPDVDIGLAMFWGLGLQHLLLSEARGDAYTDALLARIPAWLANTPPATAAPATPTPPPPQAPARGTRRRAPRT